MKTKTLLSIFVGMAVSASALASTPASYDTKFNVSANVPDSVLITDAGGVPVTEVDVVLTAAPSGYMEANTETLKLWNNDVSGLDVTLTMDDSQSSTGDAFTLYSSQGGVLNSMTYKISTITSAGEAQFAASGDSNDYTLVANGTHGELPVQFKFVSDSLYKDLGKGNYTGVVYANVVAKA